MARNIIVTSSEFEQMKSCEPVAANRKDKLKVKWQLLESIEKHYGDRWSLFKKKTIEAIDFCAYISSERGFVFASAEYLGSKHSIDESTVRKRMSDLVAVGLVVKVYRRNKRSNGLGKPIYLFTEHPYYKKWCALLGLDSHADSHVEDEDTPCGSKVEAPESIATNLLTSLKPSSNPLKPNKRMQDVSLNHTYVSDSVPKEFVAAVKPFFDDAAVIEEYWKAVRIDTYHVRANHDIDFVQIAIDAFKQMIRKLKLNAIRTKPVAYFTGIVKRKNDMALIEYNRQLEELCVY